MERLKEINWNHLYYFYEVAKAQSLKGGAESIGIASSTLSEHLKKLEANFKKTFFIRSSKGLELNGEGIKLFNQVKEIFEKGSKLLDHYSHDSIGGYPVRVGIEETISTDLSCEFASQYWDLYAQFGTVNTYRESEHESLVDSLIKGNIDWGISLREPKRKSLDFSEIGSFETLFSCSEELFDKFINKKDLLVNIPFAQTTWDKSLNKSMVRYLRKNGSLPREIIESDHPQYLRSLCERGRCVMFMPNNPHDTYEGLKTFQLEDPFKIKLYAIWKKSEEGLISIQILKNLIKSKLSQVPNRYEDVDLQIEVSEVSQKLLKDEEED